MALFSESERFSPKHGLGLIRDGVYVAQSPSDSNLGPGTYLGTSPLLTKGCEPCLKSPSRQRNPSPQLHRSHDVGRTGWITGVYHNGVVLPHAHSATSAVGPGSYQTPDQFQTLSPSRSRARSPITMGGTSKRNESHKRAVVVNGMYVHASEPENDLGPGAYSSDMNAWIKPSFNMKTTCRLRSASAPKLTRPASAPTLHPEPLLRFQSMNSSSINRITQKLDFGLDYDSPKSNTPVSPVPYLNRSFLLRKSFIDKQQKEKMKSIRAEEKKQVGPIRSSHSIGKRVSLHDKVGHLTQSRSSSASESSQNTNTQFKAKHSFPIDLSSRFRNGNNPQMPSTSPNADEFTMAYEI